MTEVVAEETSSDATVEEAKSRRLDKVGRVVSDKMDKTVVVAVENRRQHPLYRKTVTTTRKFYAHDENNECAEGDMVRIEESRPLSKTKRWVVREIIQRAERV